MAGRASHSPPPAVAGRPERRTLCWGPAGQLATFDRLSCRAN
jgi:hypothetical protein